MNLRDLKLRARALFRPHRVEQELHDELAFHLERETKKLIDEGLAPAEARQRAQARFGSATLAADECRDERGTAFIDNTIGDIQYALRTFRRAPLAACHDRGDGRDRPRCGGGALHHPEHVPVPRRPGPGHQRDVRRRAPAAWPTAALAASRVRDSKRCERKRSVFTDAYAAVSEIDLRVDGRVMAVTLVTGNFFQVVGVNAVMGRALSPADDGAVGRQSR